MLKHTKYRIKILLPVKAEEPKHKNSDARKFITLSLQRSGQHAVINWLCTQTQNIVHFNHCYFERRHTHNWITPINNRVVLYNDTGKLDSGIQGPERMINFLSKIEGYERLLYSFEDVDIEDILLNKYINKAKPTIVLIMRDPYNWLASSIKHNRDSNAMLIRKKKILIKYLEQALGVKDFLRHPTVAINYNKWATQIEYRKNICLLLDVPFLETADQATQDIQDFGGGSSFEGLAPITSNSNSNIFHRWKEYAADPFYHELLSDKYLNELTESFFQIKNPFKCADAKCC